MLCSSQRGIGVALVWCQRGVSLALAFISVLLACYGVSCCQVCITVVPVGLMQSSSCAPGSAVIIIVIYACVVTCGRSFTVLSGWGILISFLIGLVFSPTLLSFLLLLPYYYCHYCCYYYWLLLLLLFPQSSWLCVTGAWTEAGYGGWGSWLGCGQGRLLGCSYYLALGSAAPAPRFLGTQPPLQRRR